MIGCNVSRLAPGLRGLGYGMSMIPTVINFYYVVVMAYAVFFLFSGFSSTLPWTDCSNDFNTENCFSILDQQNCLDYDLGTTYYNKSCKTVEWFCHNFNKSFQEGNFTHCSDPLNANHTIPLADVTVRTYASEDFWNAKVLVS